MKLTGAFSAAALNIRREYDTRLAVGNDPVYVQQPAFFALYNNSGTLYTAPTTVKIYRGDDSYDHLFIQTGEPITGMMTWVLVWDDNLERDLFDQTLDAQATGVIAVGKSNKQTYNVDLASLKDGLVDVSDLDFLKTEQYLGELANDNLAKPARYNLGISRGSNDYFKRNVDVYLLNRTNGMGEESTIANLNGLISNYEPHFDYDLITQENFNSSIRKNRLWYNSGGRGSGWPNSYRDSWVSMHSAEIVQIVSKRYSHNDPEASEYVANNFISGYFSLNSGFPAFENRHIFDIDAGTPVTYSSTYGSVNLMSGERFFVPLQLENDRGMQYPGSMIPSSLRDMMNGTKCYFQYNSSTNAFEFYLTVFHSYTSGSRKCGFQIWI